MANDQGGNKIEKITSSHGYDRERFSKDMKKTGLLILLTCLGSLLRAAPAQTVEDAVAYLIKYTSDSNCTFIRNGKEHSSSEAARLMRYKFDANKKRIQAPEDFIRIAATKSSTTGKAYLVKMPDGKVIPSAEWLTAALQRSRKVTQK